MLSTDDPIATALSLSAGAEFRRCALQVNPHHYSETYRGQRSTLDEAGHARALVDKAEELDITVLAVTDHNHVGGVNGIRTEARRRGIHVFPGFELSSTEGIHVLCLYPPETTDGALQRLLGEFGIRATGPSSSLCDKPFSDLLERVRDQGGISIAAHVTNDKGLFRVLEGQPRYGLGRTRSSTPFRFRARFRICLLTSDQSSRIETLTTFGRTRQNRASPSRW